MEMERTQRMKATARAESKTEGALNERYDLNHGALQLDVVSHKGTKIRTRDGLTARISLNRPAARQYNLRNCFIVGSMLPSSMAN